MPLVGVITTERAAQIIESLLESISRRRSQAVIIDVTGMHAADESATDHLLHAAQPRGSWARRSSSWGSPPTSPGLFTKTGASLGGLTIRGDLTSGVEHALGLLGWAITKAR